MAPVSIAGGGKCRASRQSHPVRPAARVTGHEQNDGGLQRRQRITPQGGAAEKIENGGIRGQGGHHGPLRIWGKGFENGG